MTDQQKGYGLGIILGIRLPCLESRRSADARARGARRGGAAHSRSLYPHITSTYIRRDKFDQKLILLMSKTKQGSYFSIWTCLGSIGLDRQSLFCASIDGNRSENNDI